MKKLAILFLFILLGISFVTAGESYDIDFTQGKTQAIFLYEFDEVRFTVLGGVHSLFVDDVGTSSVKLGFVPYLNNRTEVQNVLLGLDYILRLDVDRDNIVDVNVALYSISDDGQVHLVLQDVSTFGSSSDADIGFVDSGESNSFLGNKNLFLILVVFVIISLILFLFFRNKPDDTITEESSKESKGEKISDSSITEEIKEEKSLEEVKVSILEKGEKNKVSKTLKKEDSSEKTLKEEFESS